MDSLYSPSYFHRLPLTEMERDTHHYELLKTFAADPSDPQGQVIRIFRKIAATTPASRPDRPYPPTFMHPREGVPSSYYIRPE